MLKVDFKTVKKGLEKLGDLFLANDEKIITYLIFALVYGFIFLSLDVKQVFTNTHLTGGDTGSHIYIVQYLRDIFPRLKWWSPDWYSGFPFLYFYPPLMYIFATILSFIIPINIAFKIVVFQGILIVPFAFYFTLKWFGLKFPTPQLGAVFSLFIIFLEKYTIYGGNLASLLAGQFSHTISISLLFMFLGLMYKGMKEKKYLVWNVLLGAAVMLTHPISGILLILLFPIVLFQVKELKENIKYTLFVYVGIFLLSAFWTLGLVWYKAYSGTMEWARRIDMSELFPLHWMPLNIVAGLGIVLAIFNKERRLIALFWTLWISSLLYFFVNNSSVWNVRFLPYLSFGILLLAAYFLGYILSVVRKKAPIIMSVALVCIVGFSFFMVRTNTTFVDKWFSWNFEGYEEKMPWFETGDLFKYLKTLPEGRVMWEYRPEYDKYGTPRVLETIPVFAGQPTYEGLLIESGLTGPFHFVNQAETTDKPTAAIAGFDYPPFDFDKGIKHLQMSGASYFVAYSVEVKEKAQANHDLIKLKSTGPFTVYQIKNSFVVEPIRDYSMEKQDKGWMKKAFEWYKQASPAKPIVFSRNAGEETVLRGLSKDAGAKMPENVRQTKDSIEFDVEKPGTPYLVKISYFPTWKVQGAKGPYLASPAYMMVVPTEKHVKLYFDYGIIDWVGIGLSASGVFYLLILRRYKGRIFKC